MRDFLKKLFSKVVRKLQFSEIPFEFEPLERQNVSPDKENLLRNLNLLAFLNLTNTFALEVEPQIKNALNGFFKRRYLNHEKKATPKIYLVGEPGKKMAFKFLTEEQVNFIRNAGTPTVAIEVLTGQKFNTVYLNRFLRNLRREVKKLPLELQKRLDLDEMPFRRDILQKDLKSLTPDDVKYVQAVNKAVQNTSAEFTRDLNSFAKLVITQFRKTGNIPHELLELEKIIADGIGEELLKHSSPTLNEIADIIDKNRETKKTILKTLKKVMGLENETAQRYSFSPSL